MPRPIHYLRCRSCFEKYDSAPPPPPFTCLKSFLTKSHSAIIRRKGFTSVKLWHCLWRERHTVLLLLFQEDKLLRLDGQNTFPVAVNLFEIPKGITAHQSYIFRRGEDNTKFRWRSCGDSCHGKRHRFCWPASPGGGSPWILCSEIVNVVDVNMIVGSGRGLGSWRWFVFS